MEYKIRWILQDGTSFDGAGRFNSEKKAYEYANLRILVKTSPSLKYEIVSSEDSIPTSGQVNVDKILNDLPKINFYFVDILDQKISVLPTGQSVDSNFIFCCLASDIKIPYTIHRSQLKFEYVYT